MEKAINISVIIPAFNVAPFIERAVRSALEQTEPGLEVIVIDDASTDQTREIVQALEREDDRVILVGNPTNRGQAYARNVGISMAKGEWIALLDGDDWFASDRLATLRHLGELHKADLVADNINFISHEDAKPWRTLFPQSGELVTNLTLIDFLRHDRFGRQGTLGLLQPIARRSFLDQHGIKFNEEFRPAVDFDFLVRCFRRTTGFLVCNRPMYFYRTRCGSLSSSRSVQDLYDIKVMNDRLVAEFANGASTVEHDLLEERGRSIQRFLRYRKVSDHLKAGRLFTAVAALFSDIGIIPFLTVRLSMGAYLRVRRRILINL